MAATRLIPLHINKGKTIAQTLADRTDYAENPDKTQGGELVAGYACDPRTADEEFLLSKREYEYITGRDQGKKNVLAYHIRQSFKPGEITPEEAMEAGNELAARFTKGRHAYIVAVHTDKKHIHCHIVFNSTALHTKVHEAKIRSDSHKACQIFHSISTFSLVALIRTMSPSTT